MVNQVCGHARDYFSSDAAAYVIKYFEQTLQYNCGELTDAATVPLNADNIRFIAREWLDLFALLALCVSMVGLGGMILHTKGYSELKMEMCEPISEKKSKLFWCAAALLVLSSMLAEYTVAKKGPMLGFKSEWIKASAVARLHCQYSHRFHVDNRCVLAGHSRRFWPAYPKEHRQKYL